MTKGRRGLGVTTFVVTYGMEFEWDEAKNRSNIAKHGIGFATASSMFHQARTRHRDSRLPGYGEDRFRTTGTIASGALVTVIYTERSDKVRIISARLASRIQAHTSASAVGVLKSSAKAAKKRSLCPARSSGDGPGASRRAAETILQVAGAHA